MGPHAVNAAAARAGPHDAFDPPRRGATSDPIMCAMTTPVRCQVNGDRVELDAGVTVARLLEAYDLGGVACAVEVNERIVPRRQHEEHVIADGDQVEIVSLVGGG